MPFTDETIPVTPTGLILHKAARYDLLVWLVTFGRERAFRKRLLRLAGLQPGEAVLDVGCGTGSLTIEAKRQVGSAGYVQGIDASPEMLARATQKAKRADADVAFRNGAAQSLPFREAQFDVVLNTLMLHHLPRKARQECAQEMFRVLKPGGRALIIDFGNLKPKRRGFIAGLHRHGQVSLPEIITMLDEAGFRIVESGAVGMKDLQFVLAMSGGTNP